MSTIGNERYLRYLLVLGKGGLLVLRGVVEREVAKQNVTLQEKLLRNRHKFYSLFRSQYIKIFPTSSTLNADLNTWDISILYIVLKRVFWNRLSSEDQTSITDLKNFRDETSHCDDMCMEEITYEANCRELKDCLTSIASGLSQLIKDGIDDLISNTDSAMINIQTRMNYVKELNEFKVEMLDVLGERLDGIHGMVKNVQDMVRTIMTIMSVQSNTMENREKASRLLLEHIQWSVGNVGTAMEIEIKDRIKDILEKYPTADPLLLEEVLNLLQDVTRNPNVEVGETSLGSINIAIRCFTVPGLLTHMEYMESELCKQRLRDISKAASCVLHFPISLSWTIDKDSLLKFFKHNNELRRTTRNEQAVTILMPIRSTSRRGLAHIWDLFEDGAAKDRLNKISDMLSNTLGAEVRISASVDTETFLQAVVETKNENVERCTPEDIWFPDDKKIVTLKNETAFPDILSYNERNQVLLHILNTIVSASIVLDNFKLCFEVILLTFLPNIILPALQTWALFYCFVRSVYDNHTATFEGREGTEEAYVEEFEFSDSSESDDESDDEIGD